MDDIASIAIIIVNWNGYTYTHKCLDSLKKVDYPNYKVILVDNGSSDDSLKYLELDHPEIILIKNNENLGFTGGNNIGIEYALSNNFEFIMLLNNDTEVEQAFLKPLVQELVEDANIGAVQPKILQLDKKDTIWNAGGLYNSIIGRTKTIGFNKLDTGQYDLKKTIDWISGCAILLPSNVIRQVGLLDNQFFAYYEDVDWSFRIRKAGFHLKYCPKSIVYHKAGVSSSDKNKKSGSQLSPYIHYLNIRNSLFIIRKHSSFLFLLQLLVILTLVIAYCSYFLLRLKYIKLLAVLKGFWDGITIKLLLKS